MSQKKGAKGPVGRGDTLAAIHLEPVRPYSERLPAHFRNLISLTKRKGRMP